MCIRIMLCVNACIIQLCVVPVCACVVTVYQYAICVCVHV